MKKRHAKKEEKKQTLAYITRKWGRVNLKGLNPWLEGMWKDNFKGIEQWPRQRKLGS